MDGTAYPVSPEELLTQLARTAAIEAACIPRAVRAVRPRLDRVAARLGIGVTDIPTGEEDLLCVIAAAEAVQMERFRRAPYVLLVPEPGADGAAVAAARELLSDRSGWLARDLRTDTGAALLAPLERILAASALAGEWRTAIGTEAERLDSDERALSALWAAAERDRAVIATIATPAPTPGPTAGRVSAARRTTPARESARSVDRHEADRLRQLLMEERAWVAEQANRVAESRSWRVGHRLVRIGRRLALKRDRGTDLPRMIAERMDRDVR